MQDWVDILNEEERMNNRDNQHADDDHIELPEPEIIDLNEDGSLQKRITYEYDEHDHDIIYRVERVYYIQNIKEKISQSAINRKKNWKKFGQVANVPKGQTERGVTSQRPTDVPFMWTGMKSKKPKARSNNNNQLKKPFTSSTFSSKFLSKQPREERKMNNDTSASNSSLSGKGGGYRLNKDKMKQLLGESNPVEIKISNLPQNTTRDAIKELIGALYIHHSKVEQPWPRNKIRMIPSNKTLERWRAEPIFYKKKLADYERMAIVQFPNGKNAERAIKVLDGHRYEYCILTVEKAEPRNNYNGYNNYYSRTR